MVWDGSTSALPAIAVYKSSAQTIPSNATTGVVYNAIRFAGTAGMTLLPSGVVQVPRDGWYQANGCVTFSSSTSAARRMVFLGAGTGGAVNTYHAVSIVASAQDTASLNAQAVSGIVWLPAGGVVGMSAFVNGTAWALDVSQTYMNDLTVAWLGS